MMLRHKTEEEINEMIVKMKELRPNVRRFNMFGDDNLKTFDAVMRCLEERELEVPGCVSDDAYSTVYDTILWMEGEDVESPDEDWPLIK